MAQPSKGDITPGFCLLMVVFLLVNGCLYRLNYLVGSEMRGLGGCLYQLNYLVGSEMRGLGLRLGLGLGLGLQTLFAKIPIDGGDNIKRDVPNQTNTSNNNTEYEIFHNHPPADIRMIYCSYRSFKVSF